MLLLLFRSADSLYALDARRIIEVVPRVEFRPIPHAPAYLLGLLNYRGRAVPVVDFDLLVGQPMSPVVLSTRVIVQELTTHTGQRQLVGLVASNVSHVITLDAAQAVSPAMRLEEAPYLGAVLQFEEGLVQIVNADRLLPPRLQDALYGGSAEAV